VSDTEPSSHSPVDGHGPGAILVVLQGEQDRSTVPELSETLARAIGFGNPAVVVDMSAVSFVDAAAISVIVRADLFLRHRSRTLTVRSPSRCVQRLLELCDQAALIEAPAHRGVPGGAGALASWVAVPGAPPGTPGPTIEPEAIGVSVSELLRTLDTSALG
jgi:anti-anti-sigma factor